MPNDSTAAQDVIDNAPERLMEIVCGGSGTYSAVFGFVVIVALHALLAFGTLSGVLLDASILESTGLTASQVAFANSLVFLGWIPGAASGGPLGDKVGRKTAAVAFSVLASAGLCATGLVPEGSATALFAAKALIGVGVGGFLAPAFTLLVESNDPQRRGLASVTWTWGYVAGVIILCGLHYGLSGLVGWRAEELVLGAWGFAFAAATHLLISESPLYLLASGETLAALDAARTISKWNGVDLDAALEHDESLAPLCEAAEACELIAEEEQPAEVGEVMGQQAFGTMAVTAATEAVGAAQSPNGMGADERAALANACAPLAEDYSWTDLFTGENLPLTLAFGVMEIAYNMAFYIIIFSAGQLSDQLLLNLVLLSAADLPGSTLAGSLSDTLGAKSVAQGCLAGACVTVALFAGLQGWLSMAPDLPAAASSIAGIAPAALALLSKSLCSGAFTAIFLLFSECYPVKLRSAALGCGNMFGKVGASCAAPLTAGFPLVTALSIAGGTLAMATAGASTLPPSKVNTAEEQARSVD